METTRHFTATVYVVNDGATALHEHERLGITIPPGGHVDRDELPHEAGLREVREETGLEPTLLDETDPVASPDGRELPEPRHQMLYDVDVHDGRVAHQHIDHVYYATVSSRAIDPADGESGSDAWAWYTEGDLLESGLPEDVVELGIEAIRAAETTPVN
ncbi:NUDIX domain-containing protein [Salinadaptatus halalkaliphilus]|uniref:NUDIX domain-containing protein n=1 Tax=Salinadaptatus halalkaliphilus TaxID=2419781 RepID=A0A4S3TIU6_9EURY|nr:NUDIX domain-containing protein [Salinadaptatus halalkaliphilus]THE63882.1 NUDIX domain-containing protein [Salinadaptatus halalkaliphilus]